MSTFKKTKVVMLPTNEKEVNAYFPFSLSLRRHDNVLMLRLSNPDNPYCQNQNIYFLSDEEIKEGDWVYNGTEIWQVKSYYGFQPIAKKIIATTDKSLMWHDKTPIGENVNGLWKILPQPSQLFIQKFVEEYNKGNVITEVMVEYEEKPVEELHDMYSIEHERNQRLKINPKDNTITIRKVKDSWNREEVKVILEKAIYERDQFLNKSGTLSYNFDKWIEENL